MTRAQTTPALTIACPPTLAEVMVALCWEAGTLGVEELGPGRLRAHFAEPAPAAVIRRLRAAGGVVAAEEIAVVDWVETSRGHLKPQRIGRVLVRPPWSEEAPGRGEILIEIDPARAFGTAGHESTRLMLAALQRLELSGKDVLDVGTGSGILALAALALGARAAVAVDTDLEAILATRLNAARNGLGQGLHLVLGSADALRGRYPLVVANLTAAILRGERDALVARLARGGELLLAGLLNEDVEPLFELFARAGLSRAGVEREGEWSSLHLQRS